MSRRESEAVRSHYNGTVTISDGTAESAHEVEIYIRTGHHAIAAAWHVILKDKLSTNLCSPIGKAVSIRIANGVQGVGTVIDPGHIRGVGAPPAL